MKTLLTAALLSTTLSLGAFEKIPEKYTVSLGTPEAKHKIVEYFSLSCPLCLKLLKEEFPGIYTEYIKQKKVHWTFHPDPADLSTLQLMVCLEKLPESKRWAFFWEAVSIVKPNNASRNTFLLQELAKGFGLDVPRLYDIQWLETTSAYKTAYTYLKQGDTPKALPAIEVDGAFHEKALPNKELIGDLT